MYYREGSKEREFEPEISPPPSLPNLAEIVHHALFFRAEVLKERYPKMRSDGIFEDDVPRGVLRMLSMDDKILWEEFVETAFSADKPERDEEYMEAIRGYGRIALHYPGLSMPRQYVIDRISGLWVKLKNEGIKGDLVIQGFLYDQDGHTMLEV